MLRGSLERVLGGIGEIRNTNDDVVGYISGNNHLGCR